ncbi:MULTISPECIES: response regulator [unclassified Aureimonas]|uniref:response regulator n=1 Tax=unclassified Aureimonas TaxID=2615206 RepID=UPI0006F2B6E3|nr:MULTISPECIES: response regulator [unclassified Aureimonas]KQT53963.1 MFS transporter [Aureimonas sp. Leaf427]KQT71597.1 MFS transporter [Aureimonas sp. Leaf460]
MARILIAEDDDGVRLLVARALRLEGHEVVAVEDGEVALERLVADPDFDLLLSDIRMPAMTGIELAYASAARWPDLAILLMTGYAEQKEAAEDLMRIIVGVVDKPFSLSEIRERVRDVLRDTAPAASERDAPMLRYA